LGEEGGRFTVRFTVNTDPEDIEQVWKLLRTHVPEVASGVIRVVGISRQHGLRCVLAVASNDTLIDPVGAVVGIRGQHVREIVGELGGEKMDIVRWDESTKVFIANLLAPLIVTDTTFNESSREVNVRAVRHAGSREPALTLHSKLLMDLTGWKLHVEIKDGS
jgi:N utilization substance protein A